MDVVICCMEDPSYGARISARELNFNADSVNFSMSCPMGDDWLQRVNYAPKVPPNFVRFAPGIAVVVFDIQAEASDFEQWLIRANEQVEHGFATMRG